MKNEQIVDELEKINVYKTKLLVFLKNHHPDILNAIIENTSFLHNHPTFAERLYCIKNNIVEALICPVCKTGYLKFSVSDGKYHGTCSKDCSRKSKARIEKQIKTRISKSDREKHEITEKSRKTRLQKYNGSWTSPSFVQKTKSTKLARHGSEIYCNHEKATRTNIKRYGGPTPFFDENVKTKSKMTSMAHFGVTNYGKTAESIMARNTGTRKRSWCYIAENNIVAPMFTEGEYINANVSDEFEFTCKMCGTRFKSRWDNGGLVTGCPACHPKTYGESDFENEIYAFIKSIYAGEVAKRDKTVISPKEIDIFIPDLKIGIECDGVFFHSDYYKEKPTYHMEKTEECAKKGIRLVHIFEDEWVFSKDIVIDRLSTILKKPSTQRLYARKCEIRMIKYENVDLFLRKNHIQGPFKTSINIGLYSDNELVSVMTFSKARFTKKYDYELIRYCSKIGYSVVGGASRMFKHFIKTYNPKTVISYADKRWSNGDLYRKIGFTEIGSSKPDYYYIKPPEIRRMSRVKFQKHKLKNILQSYDGSATEYRNMRNNGYYRIYDCGNLIFVYTNN